MFKIKSSARLALTLGLGVSALVLLAITLELIPNPQNQIIKSRTSLVKLLIVDVTTLAESKQVGDLSVLFRRSVAVEKDLVSIGLKRGTDGGYLASTDKLHETYASRADLEDLQVFSAPVFLNRKKWADLEVVFRKMDVKRAFGFPIYPFGIVLFLFSTITLMAWAVLGKTFNYLNPSNVVPDRVKSALDTLAEGLVLIAPGGEIAHLNEAFARIINVKDDKILGTKLDDLNWAPENESLGANFPWVICQKTKERVCGEIIQLKILGSPIRKFVVNATPIKGKGNSVRGALVSFDDVTAIENKNAELARVILSLRSSRDEVERQNEKLNFLASFDPLTKCLNRRAFFNRFEKDWNDNETGDISVMMIDVDHFKHINDNHGHSIGDEVLRTMGELLRRVVSADGLVCRYGGEEFVVLLTGVKFEKCMAIAEQIRLGLQEAMVEGVRFTASIGVSSRDFGAMDPQHMLDQADESLYDAKKSGRNQIVRFDQRPVEFLQEDSQAGLTREEFTKEIPYSAVTGLLSALSFRCSTTAQHSIRVADLCVGVGERMLGKRDLYRLEIAALLHDIGKIGVPDSILNKPGPLTANEWKIMEKHDQIGVEIVRSAFGSDKIAAIIESHHHCFHNRGEPDGDINGTIPLAGRIINVCDAFDSMTDDRVYRAPISDFDALQEIVKNTPAQFDVDVVKELLTYLQEGHSITPQESTEAIPPITDSTESHLVELFEAIELQDVEGIKRTVGLLKDETFNGGGVGEVTNRLSVAIESEDEDIERVLKLANEVIDECRNWKSGHVMRPINAVAESTGEVI
ncbi:MAG: diguanylate cyclase [Planctomycetaceae bacterium]|nr:diguanylate cyclase [Planctomycetaceae bacterium]